jgi:hypothetical protein
VKGLWKDFRRRKDEGGRMNKNPKLDTESLHLIGFDSSFLPHPSSF